MKKQRTLFQGIAVVVLVIAAYLLGRILDLGNRAYIVQCEMAVLLITLALSYVWQKKTGKQENLIKIIIIGGIIMRIGYMLYTGVTERGHDLWEISVNGTGHAGYLLTILEKHQLPQSNELQLYQQPFYYMLGAFFSEVIHLFFPNESEWYLVDAAKTVSCAASCISIFVCHEIMKECEVEEEDRRTGMLLVAFLPVCYLTGGRVGPNALAAMFLFLAFLYTMRFMKKPDWKNTVILAVIYGLGVMTKISCATLAVVTAVVFLEKLISGGDWRERGRLLGKYLVFGVISLPLGLWYSVRNYIMFGQSLYYVLRQSDNSQLYTGNYSVTERLLGIDLHNLLETPYTNVYEDYNAPVYYVKSAMFGEFRYEVPGFVPVALLWCAVIGSVVVCIAVIWQLVKNRTDRKGMFAALVFLWFYINMLIFYQKYPHGCSMDFRYMVFLVAPASVLLAKYRNAHPKSQRWIDWVFWGEAIASCVMYCII